MAYRILLADETQVSKLTGGYTFVFNEDEIVQNFMIGIVNWQLKFTDDQKIKSLKIDPVSIDPSKNDNRVIITPKITMDGDSHSLDADYSYIQFVCIAEINSTSTNTVSFGPINETVDANKNPPMNYLDSPFTLEVQQQATFWGGSNTSYGDHEQIQALDIYTSAPPISNNTLTLTGQSRFKNSSTHSGTSQAFVNYLGLTEAAKGIIEIQPVTNTSGQLQIQSGQNINPVKFSGSITFAVPLIQSIHLDFQSNQHQLYELGGGVSVNTSSDNHIPFFSFDEGTSSLSMDKGVYTIIKNDKGDNQKNSASYVTLVAVGTNQPPEDNQPAAYKQT